MQLSNEVKPFVEDLLQSRLKGDLNGPVDVVKISKRHQPAHGYSNEDWENVCEFILLLKGAGSVDGAVKLAKEYGLMLVY